MNSKDNQNHAEIRSAVLLNTFLIDKTRYRVFYNNGFLIWEKEKSKKSKSITKQRQGLAVLIFALKLNSASNDLQALLRNENLFKALCSREKQQMQFTIFPLFLLADTKICIPVEDWISITVQKQRNASSGQQIYPVLDATSPSLNSNDIPHTEFIHKSFTFNYAKRLTDHKYDQGNSSEANGNKWRIQSVTFYNNDRLIVKEWFDTLTKILNGEEVNLVRHVSMSMTFSF